MCAQKAKCGSPCRAGLCPWIAKWAADFRRAERQRRELNGLTDRELGDIGLHRSHIRAVAQGTFTR